MDAPACFRVPGCGATVSRLPPSAGHTGCDNFLALLLRVLASQTLVQQFILHGSQGLLSVACLARRSPSSFQRLIFCKALIGQLGLKVADRGLRLLRTISQLPFLPLYAS